MQKVMSNALAACTLLNVGTVLSVSALELAASASFVAAGVFGLVTVASWFKVCLFPFLPWRALSYFVPPSSFGTPLPSPKQAQNMCACLRVIGRMLMRMHVLTLCVRMRIIIWVVA